VVVLDLSLTERLTKLDEVQVTYRRTDDTRVTNNEMATVSARPFSPLEANRYAGSLGDPARMAQNFAGVSRFLRHASFFAQPSRFNQELVDFVQTCRSPGH
jgi:hypothetical protein